MKFLSTILVFLMASAALAQSPPSLNPIDPHRFFIDDEPLFLAGYYPGVQALIVEPQVVDFIHPMGNTYYTRLIDALDARNLNLLRVTLTMGMAYENREWLHPYLRSNECCTFDSGRGGNPNGNKFDLGSFNPAFFDYWDTVIDYAKSKGIIVQVAIFDGFHTRIWEEIVPAADRDKHIPLEYRGRHWDYFRAENNDNNHILSTLGAWYGGETRIKNTQLAFVDKVVEELGGHWNIIWEVANEPAVTTPTPGVPAHQWLTDMKNRIKAAETANMHSAHLIMPFDSPDHRDLSGHRTPGKNTHPTNFLAEYECVHSGSAPSDPSHNCTVPGLVADFQASSLPLIDDNDCCAEPGSPEQLRKKAWLAVVSGAHPSMLVFNVAGSANPVGLDYPVVGSGVTEEGMLYVGYTRKLIEDKNVDLVNMVPRDDLIMSASPVWALARAGEEYIVYFFNGGTATISGLPASFESVWMDPRTGLFTDGQTSGATFSAPAGGDQVLYIKASATQEMTLNPVADAYVAENQDTTNFGTGNDLQARALLSDSGKYGFLEFNVPSFSGSVVSAKLRIRTQGSQAPGVAVYEMGNMSWSEGSINYDNWDQAGAVSYNLLANTGALAANTWHDIDVTDAVSSGVVTTLGLASGIDQENVFWSRESLYRPQLRITRSGNPTPLVVTASKDAFVSESQSLTNFGSDTALRARYDPIHSGRFSFLRFAVPQFQGTLQSATLRVRTMWTQVPSAAFFEMHDMGNWSESAINWLNWDQEGTVTYSLLDSLTSLAANTWHEIDVTDAVQGPGSSLSLGIASSTDSANLKFWSRESTYSPELILNYLPTNGNGGGGKPFGSSR